MAHLIDKDALVAEINKRIINAPINYIGHQRVWAYNNVKDIINTLEVKEVDLDFQRFAKEMDAIFALPSSETKNTEEDPLIGNILSPSTFLNSYLEQKRLRYEMSRINGYLL